MGVCLHLVYSRPSTPTPLPSSKTWPIIDAEFSEQLASGSRVGWPYCYPVASWSPVGRQLDGPWGRRWGVGINVGK